MVFTIFSAVADDPMKPIASIPGWLTNSAPKVPSPGRMLTSPAGTPASSSTSTAASSVRGVCAGGLTTIALPVARPGATNSENMSTGKFQGITMPQVPTAW